MADEAKLRAIRSTWKARELGKCVGNWLDASLPGNVPRR